MGRAGWSGRMADLTPERIAEMLEGAADGRWSNGYGAAARWLRRLKRQSGCKDSDCCPQAYVLTDEEEPDDHA